MVATHILMDIHKLYNTLRKVKTWFNPYIKVFTKIGIFCVKETETWRKLKDQKLSFKALLLSNINIKISLWGLKLWDSRSAKFCGLCQRLIYHLVPLAGCILMKVPKSLPRSQNIHTQCKDQWDGWLLSLTLIWSSLQGDQPNMYAHW